jgi:hypothetical protein
MMSSKFKRLLLVLLPLLMLRLVLPKLLPLKTELLQSLMKTWSGLCNKGDPIENLSLVETRKEIPEGQDPSPSVAVYNESFDTYFKGELLSVSGEMTVADGSAPKLSLLWKSSKLMD